MLRKSNAGDTRKAAGSGRELGVLEVQSGAMQGAVGTSLQTVPLSNTGEHFSVVDIEVNLSSDSFHTSQLHTQKLIAQT